MIKYWLGSDSARLCEVDLSNPAPTLFLRHSLSLPTLKGIFQAIQLAPRDREHMASPAL